MPAPLPASEDQVSAFIAKWQQAPPAERANYALFLTELCDVLGVPHPDAAANDPSLDAYVFERGVTFVQRDGKKTTGRIDLYKRGSFVLEAKQYASEKSEPGELGLDFTVAEDPPPKKNRIARGTERWDDAMFKALAQAERYAHHLPADEPNPVFLLVVDVGHVFELYADFTQKGKAYIAFPDARTHRLPLADLARPEQRDLLRAIWLDPSSLDPTKRTTAVTLEVAKHLAALAKSFEAQKHPAKLVAEFLTRCLFCMFAEDVGLLEKDSFKRFLESMRGDPGQFVPLMAALFREMDQGASVSTLLRQKLLRFNGGLFAEQSVLPVDGTQLGLLIEAAKCQWRDVEPAIFGTLLEQALTAPERGRLGAHFTPRAYVERLVLPTVIEPLRADFTAARDEAVLLANRGDFPAARARVRDFVEKLGAVRVLDPACGSGNFLYVTLEHMKRLEGDALDLLRVFGDTTTPVVTVDPHQFLGLELNPRAVALAELVLWIGYLQWHFRIHGRVMPAEPVLKKFANIREADAVLAYDGQPVAVTGKMAAANPRIPGLPDNWRELVAQHTDTIFVWNRQTTKVDPATGREVPDVARGGITLKMYRHPCPAEWPDADFIVGNPPFIGKGKIREDLGDGYVETLRSVYPDVPEGADFVMYWWHKAAELARAGRIRRFGFITTNSLRQTFARRVLDHHFTAKPPLSLLFAIPDHPWVDPSEADEKKAAVRIAMTVGAAGEHEGELMTAVNEQPQSDGAAVVTLSAAHGRIQANLNLGANVGKTAALQANDLLASTGLILGSRGFVLTASEADALIKKDRAAKSLIFPLRNGDDLTGEPRHALVIDTNGLTEEALRSNCPHVYDHLRSTVYEDRKTNNDPKLRKFWWLFRRSNEQVRSAIAGLPRYIVTVETTKHRVFQFLDASIKPEHRLVVVGSSDAFHLGVLSSRIHVVHALAAGGTLEDRPVYNKSRCFDPFPFPDCTEKQKARIRSLAEELDAHRKRAQSQHGLGLTDIYNVLEKLRAGEPLTAKDKAVHDAALVATLRQLHDDLDAAVAAAYGWPWPLSDADILQRVVDLNTARAAEEKAGTIRWLRPDYQAKGELLLAGGSAHVAKPPAAARKPIGTPLWPAAIPAQIKAVEAALAAADRPLTVAALAKQFSRAKEPIVAEIVETLLSLGRIRPGDAPGTFVR